MTCKAVSYSFRMSKRSATAATIDLTASDSSSEGSPCDTAKTRRKPRRQEPEPELDCVVRTNVRISQKTVQLYQLVSVSANVGADGSITARVTGIPRGPRVLGKYLLLFYLSEIHKFLS